MNVRKDWSATLTTIHLGCEASPVVYFNGSEVDNLGTL
jgi:hypothetical protein